MQYCKYLVEKCISLNLYKVVVLNLISFMQMCKRERIVPVLSLDQSQESILWARAS